MMIKLKMLLEWKVSDAVDFFVDDAEAIGLVPVAAMGVAVA